MWTFVSREPQLSPFTLCQERNRTRWGSALIVSCAVHILVLLAYCLPTMPVFLKPNLLAKGEGGKSAPDAVSLYLPMDLSSQAQPKPKLALAPARQRTPSKVKPRQRHNVLPEEKPDSKEIGSVFGSSADGLAYGDEVKPALPVAFPDPQIARHELPSGLQGDVVVEITIDVRGNVVETRLLQGVGHGVDEKVIAAAREWHFHPATRNGVAVPSKQDYRFHFPS